MASSDLILKNDREWSFACFHNLIDTRENKGKSFSKITNDLKKFVFTSFSLNIFNYSIESKVLQMKDPENEEVNEIYKALKYYIKLNLPNGKFLVKKTEIINKLLIKLINEINKQEDYILEEENIKIFKKIIKYFYDLYLILLKLKDYITYEDKYLIKSIRQISNFLLNLNSLRSEFTEKNMSTYFIDFIYLGISQIAVVNSKSSLGTMDESKNLNVLCEIEKTTSLNIDKKKNSTDEKINNSLNSFDNENFSDEKKGIFESKKKFENYIELESSIDKVLQGKKNFPFNNQNTILLNPNNEEMSLFDFKENKIPNIILDNNNLNPKMEQKELINHSQNYQYHVNPLFKTENKMISNIIELRSNALNENFNENILNSSKINKINENESKISSNNYISDDIKINKNKPSIEKSLISDQPSINNEFKKNNINEIKHSQNLYINHPNSLASFDNIKTGNIKDSHNIKDYISNKQNLGDFTMYEAKLKNFTKVYFKTEDFLRDLKTTKSKDVNEYYNSLENITYNYHKNHHESFTKFPKLDEKNFSRLLKSLFPDCKSKIIGSYYMKYLTNLKENDGVIDCLIKVDTDTEDSGSTGNLTDSRNGKTSLPKIKFDKNYVIESLQNFENENYKIILKTSGIEEFKWYNILRIIVSSKKLDNKCLMDLFFFNDMYYYSNFMLEKIFHPETNDSYKNTSEVERNPQIDFKKFIKLHLFFQEILLKKIPVVCFRRFHLSILILSFLDLEYEIFNKSEKGKFNLDKLYFPDIKLEKPLEENEFRVKQKDFYFFKLKTKNFEKVVEKVRLGELIDGFFRYILCYLTFFKNVHFENGRNNRDFVDGYEILCKNFKKEFQPHLHDDNYIFNHIAIADPLFNQNQGTYNNRFVKLFKSLSNIYFKILEHSKSFKNYSEIIFNIEKFVKE